MVFVHHLFKEIVYIEFRTAIDDGFHLVQQFLKLKTLRGSNIVKGYLAVNGLNNLHLQDRLLGHCADAHIGLTLDIVLLAIALDEVDKLLGIGLADLAFTDTLDILQLLQRHRIVGSHLFYRDILEDDIGRTLQLTTDLLA